MASQILHTLFGEDVVAAASARLASRFPGRYDAAVAALTQGYRRAFALGCQGPDLFYHSQNLRPVGIQYGTLLHRRGFGSFAAALLRTSLHREMTELGAYTLGFYTHAFLDRAVHPYIVYKAGWVSPGKPESRRFKRMHPFFERILDVLMLRLLRDRDVATWDQTELLALPCEVPPEGLNQALAEGLRAAYPERAGADPVLDRRIENALADAGRFYRMTDPSRMPRSLWNPEDGWEKTRDYVALLFPSRLPLSIDYLNLAAAPWRNPCADGSEDRRSFPELYAGALAAAVDFIEAYIAEYALAGAVPRTASEWIGNGGLSVKDAAGQPCAPVWSDPLPLEEVLMMQKKIRG